MSKTNRLLRKKIYDDFSENEYHELAYLYDIEEYPNKFYKCITREYGVFDFYPMSNKINFRIKNERGIIENHWMDNGIQWIRNVLLKKI